MTKSARVAAALRYAEQVVAAPHDRPVPKQPPDRVVAVGDPQAPATKFFAILADHGLLADDGGLHDDVALISIGDHFDFGSAQDRVLAATSGPLVLSWLAAHAPSQITILVGNHDLARVGELLSMTDARFAAAVAEAVPLYRRTTLRPTGAEDEFFERYPEFPSVEASARDFSGFAEAQRDLVVRLLRGGRLRLATAVDGVLLCHAGVTLADLERIGLSRDRTWLAEEIDRALDGALTDAVAAWDGTTPFAIPGIHFPGNRNGEGGGMIYHRPAYPGADGKAFAGERHRRFDPRDLPTGLMQVIGHIRDDKCRAILGPWVTDERPEAEGRLRSLQVQGQEVRYAVGTLERGATGLVFIDGGMNLVPVADYELLDLRTLGALPREP